ncbi:MAG: glycosyl transferase family 2 [Pedosphaera sp.]|nr:glycosyl transferase family 2 [Pedosphaera sp.]
MNQTLYMLKAIWNWKTSGILSKRTLKQVKFDWQRLKTRAKRHGTKPFIPSHDRLHLGSGRHLVNGWLNVDVCKSDYDIDFACGWLPWQNHVFKAIVSQHTIEHLELKTELLPLLCELRRVLKPEGELWLSCPDIEKVCRSYMEHRMVDLIAECRTRIPKFSLGKAPSSEMINHLFHQNGEHKNLFDFELLSWALKQSGFTQISRVTETDLLEKLPGFPSRADDLQSLYVVAGGV